MGINLFSSSPVGDYLTKGLNDAVNKASDDKKRADSMKEIMNRKPETQADKAEIPATVTNKAKKPASHFNAPKPEGGAPKSWQDKMGKDAAENGKILYDVDAKNYSSKADYDKAIDEAITKRDAALKGEPAAAPADAKQDPKMTVAEGPNAGKPAEMANSQQPNQAPTQPAASASSTVNADTIAQARAITDQYFKNPSSVSPEQYAWAANVQTQDPGSTVPAMPGAAAPAQAAAATPQPAVSQPVQAPQGNIISQGVDSQGRQYYVVDERAQQQAALANNDPGIAQAAQRFYGQPQQSVANDDPGIAQAAQQFYGQQQQAGYPVGTPVNSQGRYVTGPQAQDQSEGFLGSLSKPMVGIGGLLLGGIAGYFMGKNSAENNNDDAGYGSYGGYYDA